jgi:hypothetical protein
MCTCHKTSKVVGTCIRCDAVGQVLNHWHEDLGMLCDRCHEEVS